MVSKFIIEEIDDIEYDKNVKFDEKEFYDGIHRYFTNLRTHTVKDKQRFYIWLKKMSDDYTAHFISMWDNGGEKVFKKSYLYKYDEFFNKVGDCILLITNPTFEYESYYLYRDRDLIEYLEEEELLDLYDIYEYGVYVINRIKLARPIPKGYEPPVEGNLGFYNFVIID